MSIDLNDEIVQDFLMEAGEILELLGSQLVELESAPDDGDLLNAVFRGFHTIKGGAGFLALDNLVNVSHKAEDIFDLLRKGERRIDPALMDVFLQVIDVLNEMFDELRSGEEPGPAPEELTQVLTALTAGGGLVNGDGDQVGLADSSQAKPADTAADGELTSKEFEQLMDAVSDINVAASATPVTGPDDNQSDSSDISEDEFEALLDEIHGKGRHRGVPQVGAATVPLVTAPAAQSDDEITEDEFEALLDEIHGRGRYQEHGKAAASRADNKTVAADRPNAGEMSGKAVPMAQPEVAMSPPKKAPAPPPKAETTIRVETEVLDRIMNMVGELVLLRNRLATLEPSLGNEDASKTIGALDLVTSDLQTAAMKTRMQPIKKVFGRFPRVVRDLARNMHKDIKLEMIGEDTDLDKNLVEALSDPLVHLVRNAVDHGIEAPDVREAAGKPRTGTLLLSAATEGDHILLKIVDDGAGMDAEVLRKKVVEKGLMDEAAAARLSDHECYELIFMPGFSTKNEISDVSGRGVGMDVVKTRITQLNGLVEIDSVPGKGTTLSIKLPLTLAILPTLMVALGGQRFALPLVNVNEIIDFKQSSTSTVDGQDVLLVRGRAMPIFHLSRWLVSGNDNCGVPAHVVVVSVGTQQIGLLVDQLVGQEEVVIKPLGILLQGVLGMAGATITGDGHIALILDLPSLIQCYA